MLAEEAKNLALSAFSYIANDEEHLTRFMSLSGLTGATIRQAASAPGFLPGVLDYVVSDEALLVEVAKDLQIIPERVMEAHLVLSPSDFA